jgi:hypothetical protein
VALGWRSDKLDVFLAGAHGAYLARAETLQVRTRKTDHTHKNILLQECLTRVDEECGVEEQTATADYRESIFIYYVRNHSWRR